MDAPLNSISHFRKAAGLTQRAMSDKIGIPLRTIENWESGKRNPPAWVEKLIVDNLKSLIEKDSSHI